MPALRPGVHSTAPGGSSAVWARPVAVRTGGARRPALHGARRLRRRSSAEAALPAASQARLRQLVPFSLESCWPTMSIKWSSRLAPAPFGSDAGCRGREKRVDTWLAELRSVGIEPHALCSEADGLPDIPATLVLIIEGERIVGRKPGQAPFVFDGLALTQVLSLVLARKPDEPELRHVRVFTDAAGQRPLRRRALCARRPVRERRREDSERRSLPAFRGHARATHGDQLAARRLRA